MSFLIDTSALMHLLRDRTGVLGERYDEIIEGAEAFVSRVTVFETLNGAKTPKEWSGLTRMFEDQAILTLGDEGWIEASRFPRIGGDCGNRTHSPRIVFDLRRQGLTLKNTIDAAIAQSAIEKG